jgi:hypothetical protein
VIRQPSEVRRLGVPAIFHQCSVIRAIGPAFPIIVAADPLATVVIGAGKLLDNPELVMNCPSTNSADASLPEIAAFVTQRYERRRSRPDREPGRATTARVVDHVSGGRMRRAGVE